VRADNSHHIVDAARRRRDGTLARAEAALQRLRDAGEPISVARLAEEAGVSRSWIYTQPHLRDQIDQAQAVPSGEQPAPLAHGASSASLLRRLELAHRRIQHLTDENQRLRDQLARARGQRRAERQTGQRHTATTIGPYS
jgi:hypothetical protein